MKVSVSAWFGLLPARMTELFSLRRNKLKMHQGVGKVVLTLWSKDFLCSSCHRLKLETNVPWPQPFNQSFPWNWDSSISFYKKQEANAKGKSKLNEPFQIFLRFQLKIQTRQKGLNSNSGSKNALLRWGQFKKALVFVFCLWNVD